MDKFIDTKEQYLDDETTCTICYAEFLDTEDLNIHITQIHLNEASVKRFCNLCHNIFPDLEEYVLHLKDYHLKSLQWCKYCTRVFFNNDDLKQHEIKHGESKLKSCSQCQQSFLNNDDLEAHEYNDHKDHVLSEGIMLQDSFPIFSSALHMNIRIFFTVPYTHALYSCVSCGFVTSDIDVYSQHLKMENKKPYACDKCYNVFKEKCKLRKHLMGSCNRDFKECSMCKKKFETRLFKKHSKHCLGLKCVPCDSPYFESVSNYTDHLLAHNKTIPLLTCKFCHREFVGNVALSKHIERTHKPSFHLYKYKCVMCDQLFKHPKILFAHYFSKHKELQPYTCKICDKKFRVRKGFTLHIKLDHKSVGFVEFDENYHVFFSDKKSESPFQPQSLIPESNEIYEKESDKTVSNSNITHEIDLTNVNSDFMNATETECEPDVDKKKQKVSLKRKKPKRVSTKNVIKQDKQIYETEISSNDSDAPLITITRKSIGRNYNKARATNKFVCPKCDKNCYTYQNYHHHMSLHTGCKLKRCIKCDKKFKSKHTLQKHIQSQHTSSKLTETLKQLLERRKNPNQLPKDRKAISEGFIRSMHKVNVNGHNNSTAEIKLVDTGLSAKKFIESFTPEDTSKDIKIMNSITLKEVKPGSVYKPQLIQMIKFNSEPTVLKHKLRMPVKFKQDNTTNIKANIKLVQNPTSTITKPLLALNSEVNHVDHPYTDFYENDNGLLDDKEEIPEVAEEIMLDEVEKEEEEEWTEQRARETQNSIMIPNLPQDCEDVRIGHLQAQAPYYKIVKMKDVLKTTDAPKKSVVTEAPPQNVVLPDGTKLVTVNPLAHLLGNTNVEELLKSNKKSYEPKIRDIRSAIEKAMTNMYKPKRKSN